MDPISSISESQTSNQEEFFVVEEKNREEKQENNTNVEGCSDENCQNAQLENPNNKV